MPTVPHVEKHFTATETVRDVVIGMADGLTVPFALAAGLSAAVSNTSVIVTAGLAEIAAGAIAMGLGGYLAARTDAQHFASELAREGWEIDNKRDFELNEVREVFAGYGMTGAALESVVTSITSDRKRWIDFMMRFELGLDKPDPKRAPISAATIAVSYLVGGLIPLLPYMLTSNLTEALKISVLTTGVALLVFGGVKGHFTGLNRLVGAGLGGVIMAYEMKDQMRPGDTLTVVTKDPIYHFVPSNPWVAVNWRTRESVEVDLAPTFARRGIDFKPVPVSKVMPDENRLQLEDGSTLRYDYLIIATGPELAFDEIKGLGPDGFTSSICHIDHAEKAAVNFEEFCKNPKPIVTGAVQGVSCFGPAYEFTFILDTELRRRKIRDRVPMTFVTAEPYVGHLGLDGVGDTKGILESEMREHHIKWLTNCRVKMIEDGKITAEEVAPDGSVAKTHELPFGFSMMLPAFRGIAPLRCIDGLVNPRGFVIVDKHQRNPKFNNVFSVGVCVAIAPVGPTPVPCGVPKTGFMIESMVTVTALNVGQLLRGKTPTYEPTWNAVCLADFGDNGIAFVAQPQIPPRNVNWSSDGRWVHAAKIGFEKYFLRKMRRGESEPFYETAALKMLGISKLKEVKAA